MHQVHLMANVLFPNGKARKFPLPDDIDREEADGFCAFLEDAADTRLGLCVAVEVIEVVTIEFAVIEIAVVQMGPFTVAKIATTTVGIEATTTIGTAEDA